MHASQRTSRTQFYRGPRILKEAVGSKKLQELTRTNLFFEILGFVIPWSLFCFNVYYLGSSPLGWLWFFCLFLQAFVFYMIFQHGHDCMTHRQIWGEKWSHLYMSVVLTPITYADGFSYRQSHLAHHKDLLTPGDGEGYKRNLDRRWLKIAMSLFPIFYLVMHGRFGREKQGDAKVKFQKKLEASNMKYYGLLVRQLTLVCILVCLILSPNYTFFGFLLPRWVVMPIVNVFRISWEHAEADPDNPLFNCCRLRSPIINCLMVWGVGEGHLIHHHLPNIPFYRLPRAIKLCEDVLDEYQVPLRRSGLRLTFEWLTKPNISHGSYWNKTESRVS